MWLFWTSTCWHCPTGYCNDLWPGVILFDLRKYIDHPIFARCPTIPWNRGHKVYGQGKWGQTLNAHLGRLEASMQVLQPAQNDLIKENPTCSCTADGLTDNMRGHTSKQLEFIKRANRTQWQPTHDMKWANVQILTQGLTRMEQEISKIITGVGNTVLKTCVLSKENNKILLMVVAIKSERDWLFWKVRK